MAISKIVLLISFLGLFLPSVLFAQGNFKCEFNVRDNQGKPVNGKKMELYDRKTQQKTYVDIVNGKANAVLKSGRVWQINIEKVVNFYKFEFDLPKIKDGLTGEYSRTFTYDYAAFRRETRPAVDRTQLNLKIVRQNFKASEQPTQTDGIITIHVLKANREPLTNFPVRITCFALNTTFEATTNEGGLAFFKAPLNNEFQIDIDGIEDYHYADLPPQPYAKIKTVLTYEPTNIAETLVNDTVTQTLKDDVLGTSARVAVKITFMNGGDVWQNEPVFLVAIKSKKVYKAVSNAEGICQFMLPKGDKYMINGKYQKNIDVVDLTRARGIGYSDKPVQYKPIEKYQYPERFFPKPEDLAFRDIIHFVNKKLEPPKTGEGMRMYAKFANKINANSKQAVLELALVTEKATVENRRPINISLVLDQSGSMAFENRIDKVKQALIFFTDVLNENDHVSLVVFNSENKIVFPAQKIGDQKKLLKEEISYIEAGGGTTIISGLELGFKEIEKNFKKKNTNRVVLLTDGYGDDDPLKCIAKAKEYHAKGIDCSVVGVGNDYNFGLLREIAAIGGGLTEFLDDTDNFKNIFAKELSASVFPIAENVKTEVIFNKNLLFAQLLGAPVEEKRDGKVVLKLKKAYSGVDQLALIKFSLVNPSKAIENEPVIIKTKYYDLQQEKNVEVETKAFLQWSPDDGKLEFLLEAETKYNYSVALLNQTLKVMSESFLKGDKKGARNAIVNAIKEVKEIFPKVTDDEIQDLLNKLEFYEDILNKQI